MKTFFFLVWRKGIVCPEPYHCSGNNMADATLRLFTSLPFNADNVLQIAVYSRDN